jgi:hypothetical protein
MLSLTNPPSHCLTPIQTPLGFSTPEVNVSVYKWVGQKRPSILSEPFKSIAAETACYVLEDWSKERVKWSELSIYSPARYAVELILSKYTADSYDLAKELEKHKVGVDETLIGCLINLRFTLNELLKLETTNWVKANNLPSLPCKGTILLKPVPGTVTHLFAETYQLTLNTSKEALLINGEDIL